MSAVPVQIVVQARTSSERLPGKSLLTIGGHALAVLCAKRAANRGASVCLATSDDRSDDALADTAGRAGLPVVRGPLDDVLARILLASRDLPDHGLVVRLTADNVVPDGDLVKETCDAMRSPLAYLAVEFPDSDLPYGVSVEVMTARVLREAGRAATSAADREHVTPWIRRTYRREAFRPRDAGRFGSGLRCTIDSLDDFLRVSALFDGVADPTATPWRELCRRLADAAPAARLPTRMRKGEWISTITMGMAQVGLDRYGRVQPQARPAQEDAVALVRGAANAGINRFDCAQAYGASERVAGDALRWADASHFKVITKLDPLADLPESAPVGTVRARVESSVYRSCRELRRRSLDVLMLHRWPHRTAWGGAVWDMLRELKDSGVIRALGASVYTPAEALAALADPDVVHLQLPFNVLDGRWRAAGVPDAVRRRGDVVVYARSVLLQGVLAGDASVWPVVSRTEAKQWVARLDEAARGSGRRDRYDLCLAYARGQDWVDSIVLGIQNEAQLAAAAAHAASPALDAKPCREVEDLLSGAPEALLDPRRWNETGGPST